MGNTKDDIAFLIEDLKSQRDALEKKEKALENKEEELRDILSRAAKMTFEEARKALLDQVSRELTSEIAKRIRQAEERAKLEAEEKAREILVDAMRHGATNYTAEYTVSTVGVPSE